jgi:hypothetical protein
MGNKWPLGVRRNSRFLQRTCWDRGMENEMNRRLGGRSVIVLSRFGHSAAGTSHFRVSANTPPFRSRKSHIVKAWLIKIFRHCKSSSSSSFIDINPKKYAAQIIPNLPFRLYADDLFPVETRFGVYLLRGSMLYFENPDDVSRYARPNEQNESSGLEGFDGAEKSNHELTA